ncbi:MAG: prepilin-type N-terminal cleavage/methylation domain-containing protein [Deltaproteobacteria bacterium]|nr:prepilin-type N-terminal cleavage/methylation domain-containing protein [Deltaproteobacteria bacterium]
MRRAEQGFTLVELMIVVVILGILAAIAIPLYMKFVQQSKTGEAETNLGKIATLAEQYYAKSGSQASTGTVTPGGSMILVSRFPNTPRTSACAGGAGAARTNEESVPRPASITSVQKASYQPQINEWQCTAPGPGCPSDTAWSQMNFEISSPIRYVYCYQANVTDAANQVFTVYATGDLDGDGIWSEWQRRGMSNVDGAVTIGPLAVTNQDE